MTTTRDKERDADGERPRGDRQRAWPRPSPTRAVNLVHRAIRADVSIPWCSGRELGGSGVTGASGEGI